MASATLGLSTPLLDRSLSYSAPNAASTTPSARSSGGSASSEADATSTVACVTSNIGSTPKNFASEAEAEALQGFWDLLEAKPTPGNAAKIGSYLDGLKHPALIRQVCLSPNPTCSVGGDFAPRLPVAVAAAQNYCEAMQVILARCPCAAWFGEPSKVPGEKPVTASWWAAGRGSVEALEVLYNTLPSIQGSLRQLLDVVPAPTVSFLKDKNATAEDLAPALENAVDRGCKDDVMTLYRESGGRIKRNAICSISLSEYDSTHLPAHASTSRTLLTHAIARGHESVACYLLQLEAKPDYKVTTDGKLVKADILEGDAMLALRLGQESVVESLKAKGAAVPAKQMLERALADFEGKKAASMYLCLFHSGIGPGTRAEAADLQTSASQLNLETDALRLLIIAQEFQLCLDASAQSVHREVAKNECVVWAKMAKDWLDGGASISVLHGAQPNFQLKVESAPLTMLQACVDVAVNLATNVKKSLAPKPQRLAIKGA